MIIIDGAILGNMPTSMPICHHSSDGPTVPSLERHGKLLKDFHCHCECLAKLDGTKEAEDWRLELCHYLKVIAKDVLPKADVVQWWQVCLH